MTKDRPGILITFEGGEGGGKTTQAARLRERLSKVGREVILVREPGGTVISEKVRQIVLDKENTSMDDTAEVLLFQAGRAQIYSEIVLPSLKAGKVVLMDRSRDSSVVYQGIVRGFGKALIDQLNDISTKQTLPDMTFLLDIPPAVGLKRQSVNEELNRMELQGMKFHQSVNQAYLQLAKEDTTGRWVIVDASVSLEEVEEEIWERVRVKLEINK